MQTVDAVVIGAGPAGLATSAALGRKGIAHAVLERGTQPGETWAHLYDSLVLHTAKRLSALPGLPFSDTTPKFPTRTDFLAYLNRYAAGFHLPLQVRSNVGHVKRSGDAWLVRTTSGTEWLARSVVIATGIVANPFVPEIPGRDGFSGEVLHSVDYRRPAAFEGKRVLVVGAGNSAGEIASEMSRAGTRVTLAVRSGALVVPREIAGIPIQYLSLVVGTFPKAAQRVVAAAMAQVSALMRGPAVLPPPPLTPCPRVPIIGMHLVDAIRSGAIALKGGIGAFTPRGARFLDGTDAEFDVVMLATGFRPALGPVRELIQLDECGFASRSDRVASADQPDLYFVGHNYGIQGGLFNIGRDAKRVAAAVSRATRDTSRRGTETPPRANEK